MPRITLISSSWVGQPKIFSNFRIQRVLNLSGFQLISLYEILTCTFWSESLAGKTKKPFACLVEFILENSKVKILNSSWSVSEKRFQPTLIVLYQATVWPMRLASRTECCMLEGHNLHREGERESLNHKRTAVRLTDSAWLYQSDQ